MQESHTDVLVVGGGQAGIAMSEHLGQRGIKHLVIERDRIAERWRTGRWDSLVANGPAWHDRFPNLEFNGIEPEAFATKDQVAEYFEQYVSKLGAPVRTGVEVTKVTRNEGRRGFTAQTSEGAIQANYVVAATGPFQKPVIPRIIPESNPVNQIHSSAYRNPQQLPEGNVLVVGAGSSGVQIAQELRASGRQVYLAVGPHDRPPRRYRGQDFCWWLGVLNKWEMSAPPQGAEHVTIAVSGANGGQTVNFRTLGHQGITLVGRATTYSDGVLRFDPDLAANVASGDENYLSILDEADAYIERNGLDFPVEPEARDLGDLPECITDPLVELDLQAAGVSTIVWATGFTVDYSWLEADTFDERGRPKHQKGVSEEPGVYFLGLPWQSRRGSSFIWGVWHDAQYIADQISIQRSYAEHLPMDSSLGLSATALA
ncbi:flavin-containing monooxygenase [Glutamicibacter sp.]|uniref:flavin-containing monooxygenase n=1 Tax=Glutamicibacter sp. TaxID=1931995 RepID=UPI003D6BADDB